MSWTSGGAAACAAVCAIACAGAPAQVATVEPAAAQQAVPQDSGPLELRVFEIPESGVLRPADDSGQRFVQGGIRFELHGEQIELASELARVELTAYHVGDAWLFVDSAHGRVLRSDTFLGPLTEHGQADTTELEPCLGDLGPRLLLLGGVGVLYEANGETPLTPVTALADRMTQLCGLSDPTHGHALTLRGELETTDGGATWSEVTPARSRPSQALRSLLAQPSRPHLPPRRRREIHLRVAYAILARLGLESDQDTAPPPMPEERCVPAGLHIAVCPSGVFVASGESDTWTHVAAGEERYPNPVTASDGESALLGWGCHGEEGRLCLVDSDPPGATPVDRWLELNDAEAFVGDDVYLRSRGGALVVNVHSGETRVLTLPPTPEGHERDLRAMDVLPDGTVFLETVDDSGGERRAVLYRVEPDASSPAEVTLPPDTSSVAMFDDQRGFAVDIGRVVHRTEDGGAVWTPTDLRHQSSSVPEDAVQCARDSCRGGGWMAIAVPPGAPEPDLGVRPGPEPTAVPATMRCQPTSAGVVRHAAVQHEVRRNKLHVTVQWETSSGPARAAGFIRGESQDGWGWEVLAHTDALALVAYVTEQSERKVVLATARGRVRPLRTGSFGTTPGPSAVRTRSGALVAFLPAPHLIDDRGRVTGLVPGATSDDPPFTAVRSDAQGNVELGRWAPTRSGAIRIVTGSGDEVRVRAGDEGVATCEDAPAPTRWWLRAGARALPLRLGLGATHRRRIDTDVEVDIDADGAGCLRSIGLDGAPVSASDRAFTTRYGNVCRIAD